MTEQNPKETGFRQPGGLYRNVNMSVKAAERLILIGFVALILTTLLLVRFNGFTVTYDAAGGSAVPGERVLYGETLSPQTPQREGYRFDGWYRDKELSIPFHIQSDIVTESVTLYAAWEKIR